MKFYFQNDEGDEVFEMTQALWDAALARAGESGHEVRFGTSDTAFAEGVAWADVLVGQTSSLNGRFPVAAPGLKMIFLTSAGVDKLAPFDRLPPGVAIANNSGVHSAKAGEYTAMALLMLNAKLPAMLGNQRKQAWVPMTSSTLRGRRVTG